MNKDRGPEQLRASPSRSGRIPLSLPTLALPCEKLALQGDTGAVPKSQPGGSGRADFIQQLAL